MNLKKLTLKNLKDGLLNLTIEQQLKSKLIGILGGIVGLILALISFIYKRLWGFSIFIFFIIWIQAITYVGVRQQYLQTKEIMKDAHNQLQGKE